MKAIDRFSWPKNYAAVSQNMASNWVRFYEWAGSDTKKFTGHFLDVEDAIKAVPAKYRMIKVEITDDNGKPISYVINRDAPTENSGNGEHILQQTNGTED